jgi:ABC-type bacteriocin/lantibiotic exporter with double-glycine peptidase domain
MVAKKIRKLNVLNLLTKVKIQVATESIGNIRTVAGLVRERDVLAEYTALLEEPHRTSLRTAHIRGLVFGFGQAMPFFAYALSLYYGGYLVYYEGLHFEKIIK